MLIGAIITVALLSLVIDLAGTNQRDVSRSETQREMQLAMNYISQDLREAVYVYDGDCLEVSGSTADFNTFCPGILNHVSPAMRTANATLRYIPVLAFWRADNLPQPVVDQCATNSRNMSEDAFDTYLTNSNTPCVSGRSYTLVVYAIADDRSTTDVWQGKARLVRYKLAQFDADGDSNADEGWVNPLEGGSGFQQWPYTRDEDSGTVTNSQTVSPSNQPDVLVDFIDDTNVTTLPANQRPTCPAPSIITPKDNVGFNPDNIRSFYACVRGNTLNAQVSGLTQELNVNQEVQLVLTGNVAGRSGFPINSASNPDRLSPLQTRVLTRGAVDKNPRS